MKHELNGQSMNDGGRRELHVKNTMPRVEVLLATYNGERFLREQIDSILSQDYRDLSVFARDDGSSDGTPGILSEYAERFPDRFRVVATDRATGSAKGNFLQLMNASTAEYVCFSDQDDVWLADKVSKTMQAMSRLESSRGTGTPLLVFTDLRVVDDALNTVDESFWRQGGIKPRQITNFASLLGHNVVTGCTALINRRLLEMSVRMPEEAAMHDSWIALLASALGAAEVVREKTVLYRQHDQNVVGVDRRPGSPQGLVGRLSSGGARILQWRVNERQAEAFLRVYDKELPTAKREVIEAYLRCGRSESRFVRVSTMIRYRFFRSGLLRNIATFVDLWKGKMDGQAV
jgi:glycosyltransferase involved in cell wall biosynthesis